MIKFLDIKGCSVINNSGKRLGNVENCIFDRRNKRICSCVVIRKTPRIYSYILRFDDIKHFGDNLITNGRLFYVNKNIIAKNSNRMFYSYIDKPIIDVYGNSIGEMKDAIIDEGTGTVKAIICSRGFVEDMLDGRRVLLATRETVWGQDKIIIKGSEINIYNDMSIWKLTRG